MDGIIDGPARPRASLRGVRRVHLLVLAVLVVTALGVGYAFWPGSPAAAGSGAVGANPAGEGALPVGWVDAIDECDCTFGQ